MTPPAPPSPDVPTSPTAHGAFRWMVGLALCVNLGLVGLLFYSQVRTNAALSKLEKSLAARAVPNPDSSGEDRPRTVAGRGERIALLLAASADAEQARRILAPLPPGECIEIARALIARPAANDRNTALGAVLQIIAGSDPGQAIDLLAAVTEAGLRSDLAAKISATWIEQDPAAAAAWLTADGGLTLARAPLRRLLASAVARWAAFDPAATTRFVAASPPGSTADEQTLRTVSRDWARKDPGAALAWVQTIPPGDPRKAPATYGVLEGWTELAPAQAGGYVGQLSFSTSRNYAGEAAAVATRWTEQDPSAAAQWAAGLPDRFARRDGLRQVAATWAKADAPSAARWAGRLPPSGERAEIWQGVTDFWADADPSGAEAWLSTLPAGGDRDAAVAAYAAKIVPTDPEKALTWAKTLSGGPFAAQQIQVLLTMWSRRDTPAARNWALANQVSILPPGSGR